MSTCKCDDCQWTGQQEQLGHQLEDVPSLGSRLDVGSVVPAGECPECGALAYLEEHPNIPTASNTLRAIHALMDGTEWDADTFQEIAALLSSAGLTMRDPNDMPEDDDYDGPETPAQRRCAHEWNMTAGEADENNISGEGPQVIVCVKCGLNGDA